MDRGKRAITIDEVPLEWCLQPEQTTWPYSRNRHRVAAWADVLQAQSDYVGWAIYVENLLRWSYY
jgi:hypothetical protein